MKRILVMVLKNLIRIPYYAICLLLYSRENDRHSDQQKYNFLKKIVYYANRGGNVKIVSSGQDLLPEKNGFILYPNHQGMYDMLAIIDSFDRPLSAVLKKEVANVPFVKQIRKIMRALPMDREDVRQSMKVILQVAKEVEEGRIYTIFAEGTRSRKGNQLLDFKGGSFKAAMKAKCPIVPVALINSFVPFDSDSLEQVTVQIHYLKPIPYEEYKDMKTNEIAAMVKEKIQQKINEEIM